MVFRYPPKPSLDYIKRVVGVPGDEVAYLNKQLTINGQPVPKKPLPDFFDEDGDALLQAVRGNARRQAHCASSTTTAAPAFIPGVENFPYQAELPLQCRGRGLQGARRATIS